MEKARRLATEIVQRAGVAIRDYVGQKIKVQSKGPRDLVTTADVDAQQIIIDAIRGEYPEHDILSEEMTPSDYQSHYRWVVDPLDGTANFVRGHPLFSSSVALLRDGEPIVGAVYDPMRNYLFAASLGAGATLNGHALQVSTIAEIADSVIGMDFACHQLARKEALSIMADLVPACGSFRVCGSAALGICYVAAGWWDAYWHVLLEPWDAAAGVLIVREAGGKATDLVSQRWCPTRGSLVVSNGQVHADVLARLAGINSDMASA